MSDYKAAGVDIDAGNETVRRIRALARGTFTPGVLSEIGSFGGLFRLDRERYKSPVLVSSAAFPIRLPKTGSGVEQVPSDAPHTSSHSPLSAFAWLTAIANMSPLPGCTASAAL